MHLKHYEIFDNGNSTWCLQLGSVHDHGGVRYVVVPSFAAAVELLAILLEERL